MAEKINVAELDKFDPRDFVIPITFQISDFREMESRKGSVSKTVKLPGTKRNDTIFSNYYKISAEGIFNSNKRSESFLQIGSNRLIEGGLHLKAANIDNGRIHSYEIILLGDNASWFDLIKEKSIRDIPMPTIEFTEASVIASWDNNGNGQDFHVFPLINYGRLRNLNKITDPIFTNDYRPAIFIKKIENNYDRVIFDAPPALHIPDALILANRMHGVLFVVRYGMTHYEQIRRVRDLFLSQGSVLLGTIINRVDYKKLGRNSYGYYKSYQKYYTQKTRASI